MKRFSKMFSVTIEVPCGLRGERHVLRLHVGGEAGILFGVHVGGLERLIAHDADGVGFDRGLDAGFFQLGEDGGEVRGVAAGDVEVAAGERARDDERAGLDAVGNDAVLCAVQLADAFHADRRSTRAFDLRAHGVEQCGEVGDFGLAGAILHDGLAFGERGGHEQVFGAGDGDLVENDFGAVEAVGGGFDVAVFLRDLCAETLETLDVEIDGAGADGAAAGQRDVGASATGDQRAEHESRGAHGLDQFVGSFGRGQRAWRRWWCGGGRVRSRVRLRRPWRPAACGWFRCRGPAGCFRE